MPKKQQSSEGMTRTTDNILPANIRSQLLAMQRTARDSAETQQRLASGKKVNSAIDDPVNFFSARSLENVARDSERLLDGMGQNIQVVKAATDGLETIMKLLELSEAATIEALEHGGGIPTSTDPLSTQILADNPAAYFAMDELAGTAVGNQGSGGIVANYQNGVTLGQPPLYDGGGTSVSFNGTNQFISINNSALINTAPVTERTIELAFNANDVASRQVLYEEGGATNSLVIYIEGGAVYVSGRDAGDWGPFNISSGISAGTTHHVALQLDQPNGELRGYLDGNLIGTGAVTIPLSNHTGAIAIGGMRSDSYFHNGPQNGNGYYFNGSISDFALYNTVVPEADIEAHAATVTGSFPTELEQNVNDILAQLDQVALSSHYRGTNLLDGDLMQTRFNADGSAILDTQGADMTTAGLGIIAPVMFDSIANTQATLDQIRAAMDTVRAFTRSLGTDLNLIKGRSSFTRQKIETHQEGADKLTLADMNEEGAKMLAVQTRQDLQMTVLSLAADNKLADILFSLTRR